MNHPRKVGAQPGNKNAFKHGIYARRFTSGEANSIEAMGKDLDGEIALLRKHINGLAASLESTDYGDSDLSRLNCLGDLILRVSSVIRTQAWMTGRISPTARSSVAAIFLRRDEWSEIQP